MAYVQLPSKWQRREMLWQVLDTAAILAIACSVTAWFTHNVGISLILFVSSLVSVVLYLLLELRYEQVYFSAKELSQQSNAVQPESRANLLLWGVIIGCLAAGNFVWFFARHGVNIAAIPITAPIYKDAVALAALTIILCLLAGVLHQRYHFAKSLGLTGLQKAIHVKSYVLSLLFTLAIIWLALLISPYQADYFFAVIAALLFWGFREFQRYDRQHHRSAIRALHKSTISKS